MSPQTRTTKFFTLFATCFALGVSVPSAVADPQTPLPLTQSPVTVMTQPTVDQWTSGTTTPATTNPVTTSPAPTTSTETGTETTTTDDDGKSFKKGGSSKSDPKTETDEKTPDKVGKTKWRDPDGKPTKDNPTLSITNPGMSPIGVPNFMIDKFRIPPFLLPIYQAAGTEYSVPWQVLAAINEVETDYGRNLSVSSAGALGWMQFMPSSWKTYGVDANNDNKKDPNNPADAIFAAARYLRAAGADKDLKKAIFAYNHADWYVDMVLVRARLLGGMPVPLVSSLTGLTEGRFPVDAKTTYADDVGEKEQAKTTEDGNAAVTVNSDPNRRSINLFADVDSPVVAINDGKIKEIGTSAELGNYVVLRDVYGNEYTYSHLKDTAEKYLAPKPQEVSAKDIARELKLPNTDPKPEEPASATDQSAVTAKKAAHKHQRRERARTTKARSLDKERLYAHPTRPHTYKAGGREQLLGEGEALGVGDSMKRYFSGVYGLKREDVVLKPLSKDAQVIGGTVLGHVGQGNDGLAPHIQFEIRPAGKGAPKIDPKPILDGWKLLESTAVYRAAGINPFVARTANNKDERKVEAPTVGQIILMSKEKLQQIVLADPRIKVYDCGRQDIQAGIIDRRVLATLEYLASSGLKPTITSLKCGHGFFTASGNVSEHTTGSAVDIAEVNGTPIIGHQGKGTITERTILALLDLQGLMQPHQIISLMEFKDHPNTLAMADHNDHIHVGFEPFYTDNPVVGKYMRSALKPDQWNKLMERLSSIDNPTVSNKVSKFATPVTESEPRSDAEKELEN